MNVLVPIACCALALLTCACKEQTGDPPSAADKGADKSTAESPASGSPGPDGSQTARRNALADELGTLMASFGTSVRGVSDALSWERARAEITATIARVEAITAELRTLPPPDEGEVTAYRTAMAAHEASLEKQLGDKTSFLRNLPPETSGALQRLAGEFSMKMGTAQQTLYGAATRTPPAP